MRCGSDGDLRGALDALCPEQWCQGEDDDDQADRREGNLPALVAPGEDRSAETEDEPDREEDPSAQLADVDEAVEREVEPLAESVGERAVVDGCRRCRRACVRRGCHEDVDGDDRGQGRHR